MRLKAIAASIFGLAMFGLAAPAGAEIKWTLNSGAAGCSTSGSGFGNSRDCPADSGPLNDVTATAWSFTANDGGTNNALQSAFLGVYGGGLGVTNQDGTTAGPSCASGLDCDEGRPSSTDSPEHAVDNNQRFDTVLFSFDSAVKLSRVVTGFVSGDSDLTVLAYTGGAVPALGGQTVAELLGGVVGGQGGWAAIGDYAGGSGTGSRDINTGAVSSKFWLISSYNPNFGAADIGSPGSPYDHFKIKLVAATENGQVPEPSTMLLFAAGAAGLWWRRRLRRVLSVSLAVEMQDTARRQGTAHDEPRRGRSGWTGRRWAWTPPPFSDRAVSGETAGQEKGREKPHDPTASMCQSGSSTNHLRTEASRGQAYDNCRGHRKASVQRVLGGCADGRDRRQDDESGEVRGVHAHA